MPLAICANRRKAECDQPSRRAEEGSRAAGPCLAVFRKNLYETALSRHGKVRLENHRAHSGATMANLRSSGLLRQVGALFGAGTVSCLSDAQLLERFRSRSSSAAEDKLAAEVAFEVLVARHGPMVLGVCRRVLADPAEVDDAFQATFLVLVRRAGSVRVGDSLGRWLYGVSRRVAAKARARSHRARIRTRPLDVEPTAPDTRPISPDYWRRSTMK